MKKNIFLFIIIGIFIGLLSTYLFYKDDQKEAVKEELLPWNLYDEYYLKAKTLFDSVLLNEKIYGISKSEKVTINDLNDDELNTIVATYAYNIDLFEKQKFTFNKFDSLSMELFGKKINREDDISIYDGTMLRANDKNKSYDFSYILKEYIEIRNVLIDEVRGSYIFGNEIYFDIPFTYVTHTDSNVAFSNDSKFKNIYCEGYDCYNKIEYRICRIKFLFDNSINKYIFNSAIVIG